MSNISHIDKLNFRILHGVHEIEYVLLIIQEYLFKKSKYGNILNNTDIDNITATNGTFTALHSAYNLLVDLTDLLNASPLYWVYFGGNKKSTVKKLINSLNIEVYELGKSIEWITLTLGGIWHGYIDVNAKSNGIPSYSLANSRDVIENIVAIKTHFMYICDKLKILRNVYNNPIVRFVGKIEHILISWKRR